MSDVNGTVVGLQGNPVSATAPNDQEALVWDATAGEWQPKAPPQPLEPWVGTVNTQQQVIKRIPWTCRTVGTTSQNLLSITLPTDTALCLNVYSIFRHPSVVGCLALQVLLTTSNVGGSLSTPPSAQGFGSAVSGSFAPATNAPVFEIDTSGPIATLKVTFYSAQPTTVVEGQGYVDLMLI